MSPRISEHELDRRGALADTNVALTRALTESMAKHDLAYTETWSVLADFCARWASHALRAEWDGGPDGEAACGAPETDRG